MMIRRAILLILPLLGGSAQAADWPMYDHDVRRSGRTAESLPVSRLAEQWTYRSPQPPQPAWPGPAKWDAYASIVGLRAMRDYDTAFQPVVVDQSLYFGSSADDAVHCLDTRSGETRWLFVTDAPVRMAPTVIDERVYFGSDDGHAYCVKADSGELIWKSKQVSDKRLILNNARFISRYPCRTGVLVHEGTAWFGLSLLPWDQSFLCAVDAQTGSDSGPGRFVRPHSNQTLEGGLLVDDQRVIALRGRVSPALFDRHDGRWLGELQEGGGGAFASLTAAGTLLHGPGNKTGWISDSDLTTRKRVSHSLGHTAAIDVKDRLILLADDSVSVRHRDSNQEVWKAGGVDLVKMILAGNVVIVGGQDHVRAFDLEDGRELWQATVEGRAFGLIVADGALFVSTDHGKLSCFRPGPASQSVSVDSERDLSVPVEQAAEGGSEQAVEPPTMGGAVQPPPRGLLGQWVFRSGMGQRARRRGASSPDRRVQDMAGSADGLISGNVLVREVGGVEALELDGTSNSVLIAADHREARLPVQAMTAEAWVRVDQPLRWGGIVGAVQDNGSDEHGWTLGYQDSRFSFAVASQEGPGKLTYLTSQTSFESQLWYHVVGTYDGMTQKIYVNGVLENETREQRGAIDYPPQAFFELGAYHDQDENFRMTGMLHEVRVYDRALESHEIARLHAAKRGLFAVPVRLASGPMATFADPTTAVIRWTTARPSPTVLELSGHGPMRRVVEDERRTEHQVTLSNLSPNQVGRYVIRTDFDGEVGISPSFELDTGFNYTSPTIQQVPQFPPAVLSRSRRLVQRILDESQVDRGLCLVVGIRDASVASELARSSRLHVVCVDTDSQRVAEVRRSLIESGVYGKRLCVRHVNGYADLPFVGRCANLIISERQLLDGELVVAPEELDRVLRPFGGVAFFDWASDVTRPSNSELQRWLESISADHELTDHQSNLQVRIRQAELAGTGEWSHLYGPADNSAFGGETLEGASTVGELEVQWIGRPGPRAQPDRNGRKPSPLSVNGRLFVQGLHRLIGLDAMNGIPLWSLEIPSLERFNMPRDCGNWCADRQQVYVAIRDQCWQIDANSGDVVQKYSVIDGDRAEWDYDWSYVARVGDLLLGSAVKQGTAFTNFWGKADAGWYDARSGSTTFKVCSENLFALDPESGQSRWTYQNGVILNCTISADASCIYFVECRHPLVKQSAARRVGMAELWQQQYLVALDLVSGKKLWERPIDTADGVVVFYLAKSGDRLVLSSSNNLQYDVYAFATVDGKALWHQSFGWPEGKGDHGKAMSRPAIVGNMVLVRPRALDLQTGEILPVEMPAGGCGTYVATTRAVFFRSGNVTAWDPLTGSTTDWNRLRPGCWLSTIPANGMLLSPEAGGGCSCGSWLETSLGFMPVAE